MPTNSRELHPSDRGVLEYLIWLARREPATIISADIRTIAEETGFGRSTVSDALRRLVAGGWLEARREGFIIRKIPDGPPWEPIWGIPGFRKLRDVWLALGRLGPTTAATLAADVQKSYRTVVDHLHALEEKELTEKVGEDARGSTLWRGREPTQEQRRRWDALVEVRAAHRARVNDNEREDYEAWRQERRPPDRSTVFLRILQPDGTVLVPPRPLPRQRDENEGTQAPEPE